jgi:hypothetical protein
MLTKQQFFYKKYDQEVSCGEDHFPDRGSRLHPTLCGSMARHHAQVRDSNKVLFPVPPRVKMTSLIAAAAFTLLFVAKRFYFRFLHVLTISRLQDFLPASVLLSLMICTYVFRILFPNHSSVCLSLCLSVCLPVCLPAYLPACLPACVRPACLPDVFTQFLPVSASLCAY